MVSSVVPLVVVVALRGPFAPKGPQNGSYDNGRCCGPFGLASGEFPRSLLPKGTTELYRPRAFPSGKFWHLYHMRWSVVPFGKRDHRALPTDDLFEPASTC